MTEKTGEAGADRGSRKGPRRGLWPRPCASELSPLLQSLPHTEGAGLPTPRPQTPVTRSGHWAIPGFLGPTCTALGLHCFWPEEEPALNQVQQPVPGNLELADTHWCSGSSSREHRSSPAVVRLGEEPQTKRSPWKARWEGGTRAWGTRRQCCRTLRALWVPRARGGSCRETVARLGDAGRWDLLLITRSCLLFCGLGLCRGFVEEKGSEVQKPERHRSGWF